MYLCVYIYNIHTYKFAYMYMCMPAILFPYTYLQIQAIGRLSNQPSPTGVDRPLHCLPFASALGESIEMVLFDRCVPGISGQISANKKASLQWLFVGNQPKNDPNSDD